jgi:transcriptional regulator with XRE-family HTH domain
VIEPSRLRVARNLLNLRHARGLTQSELGVLAGLDRTYICSIEQGRRNVSIDSIDRLAAALGVDAQDLLAKFSSQGDRSV